MVKGKVKRTRSGCHGFQVYCIVEHFCLRNFRIDLHHVSAKVFLPRRHITSPYIFCHRNDFFAYPNNYNQYVQYYMNTFQHGGISMEEILIPFIVLKPKA